MRIGIIAGLIGVLCAAGAGADELAAAMRGIVAKNEPAVVQIKMTVKETYSMPEYGTEESEYTDEITATVISPEGLMVTSLMHTDPMSMMEDYMDGEDGYSGKSEVTALKVLRGQSEIDAEIVLRDRDLDLAFLRPLKKPEAPVAFVDLSAAVKAEAFDQVVTLSRMGKVVQRMATANEMRIAAVQERPRLNYILGTYMGEGTPVFLPSGECLGVNVNRMLRSSGQNGMGMSEEDYDMNMASVVVPGTEILEIAKQVPAYKTE